MSVFTLVLLLAAPERTIDLRQTVPCSRAETFMLWSTTTGVKQFFAPDALVETRVGGAYTIIFDPAADPEGRSSGTRGARILRFDPPNHVTFEWIPFIARDLKNTHLPPYAPPEIRDAQPLPTRVEIDLREVDGDQTEVRLRHAGFRTGKYWDEAFEYFRDRAWPLVLNRLKAACQERRDRPPITSFIPAEFDTQQLVLLKRGSREGLSESEQSELQYQHLAYLKKRSDAGEFVTYGPFAVDATSELRGVVLFRPGVTREQALATISADPLVRSGALRFEILPWMTAKGALK